MKQISAKKNLFASMAVLLAALLVMVGILFNAQQPKLSNRAPLTASAAGQGATLVEWEQLSAQEWQFTLNAADLSGTPLMLCFSGTNSGQPIGLTAANPSGEMFWLEKDTAQPIPLRVRCLREPQCWIMTADRAIGGMEARSLLQLMTLTAFVTMAAMVLALFCYKRQAELGYFLLYLAVLVFWGFFVYLFPASQNPFFRFILRFFF